MTYEAPQSAPQRSRSLQERLPTYLIFAALIAVGIVTAERRHLLSQQSLIFFCCFIPAVILHEVSHGVMALWCGDDTAKRAGRLTLNPIKHVDPFGTIIMPILFLLGGFVPFMYAKPVPVSLNRLRHPRDQAVLVGLVGPATNIVLAAIAGLAFHLAFPHFAPVPFINDLALVLQILFYFGLANIALAVFNLIPIPPLDGSAILERLLPTRLLPQYYRMRMGMMVVIIVIVLFYPGPLDTLLGNVENWYLNLIL